MPDLHIVIIEAVASIFFLGSFFYGFNVYRKTRSKTDIWLLISIAIFIGILMTGLNALEWYLDESAILDKAGEILAIGFSAVWIYIAYRFISLKQPPQKTAS